MSSNVPFVYRHYVITIKAWFGVTQHALAACETTFWGVKCPETVTLNETNVIRNINNLISPQAFSVACQSDARRVGLHQDCELLWIHTLTWKWSVNWRVNSAWQHETSPPTLDSSFIFEFDAVIFYFDFGSRDLQTLSNSNISYQVFMV